MGNIIMNKRLWIVQSLLFIFLAVQATTGQTTQNRLVIDVDLGTETIDRNIYGHFAEHLGRCIYGGFWVGEDSDIPNTRGIRNDVVEALRELHIPILRWPGGCFADEYHWMDGIGPRDQRPSMINTHWGGVSEDNSFGTHEFMDLCELLECEPYISANLGSGTVREMAQWVEYMTSDAVSPMTELRKQNGREKPWKVKYWGIGNESWGCGGSMEPGYYDDLMRHYSTYCKNYGDNRLYKIACGANSYDYEWTRVLMQDSQNRRQMHGLSLHYYTVTHNWRNKGSATDFDESEWFQTLSKTLQMEELIQRHSTIMDEYDPDKRIGMMVDEWGTWHDVEPGTNPGFLYQQNTLRDALAAAINLNIFNHHCDRVKMANIAQTVNVLQAMILTQDREMILTPTYHVFKMYRVHQDATLLPAHLSSEQYSLGENSIPALYASASKDANNRIHISVVNVNPHEDIQLACELRGRNAIETVTAEILTANRMNAYNKFGKDPAVGIKPFKSLRIDGHSLIIDMPARSVVVIEVK